MIDMEGTVRNQREDKAKALVAKEMKYGNQTLGLVRHCPRDLHPTHTELELLEGKFPSK